mmetsp:Transcript_12663/g.25694  ORF Transcript_12663/g.25694 Transcript_12663/m.25694 type:complete len:107 (-) Transcript_12663:3743-4063(-)
MGRRVAQGGGVDGRWDRYECQVVRVISYVRGEIGLWKNLWGHIINGESKREASGHRLRSGNLLRALDVGHIWHSIGQGVSGVPGGKGTVQVSSRTINLSGFLASLF